MRQLDASDVSESIPVLTSPVAAPTARVKCTKPTAPLKTIRTIRIVSRTYLGQQTEFRALDSTGGRA
eukprot:1742796-Pyramimonas_sp.AAC.1